MKMTIPGVNYLFKGTYAKLIKKYKPKNLRRARMNKKSVKVGLKKYYYMMENRFWNFSLI